MEAMTMSDTSDTRSASNTGPTLMGFAIGAIVGAGVALLLAPASGERTREHIALASRRWTKNARNTLDHARETVADLGVGARSAVEAGRTAFKESRQNSDKPRPASRTVVKG
jgi:gas vesicle protein